MMSQLRSAHPGYTVRAQYASIRRMETLRLLLADGDTLKPVLPAGLPVESVATAVESVATAPGAPAKPPTVLFSRVGEENNLAVQRWAIVVPEERGEELKQSVAKLIEARAAEQGSEVRCL